MSQYVFMHSYECVFGFHRMYKIMFGIKICEYQAYLHTQPRHDAIRHDAYPHMHILTRTYSEKTEDEITKTHINIQTIISFSTLYYGNVQPRNP